MSLSAELERRDAFVTQRTRITLAYGLVADARERHHHDGDFAIDCKELEDLARALYAWQKRLWETQL